MSTAAPTHGSVPPRRTRSAPGEPRQPGWTQKQRTMFLRACTIAEITGDQRYIVMRHCGCPLDGKSKRPSVKHPRNSNTMFEQCMAVAEAHAGMRGASVPAPRGFPSWKAAAQSGGVRARHKARCIIKEAQQELPAFFDEGLEAYIVGHTTASDDGALALVKPRTLEEADPAQCLRIADALAAYVGREFLAAGITPHTFTIPPAARRRVEKRTRTD